MLWRWRPVAAVPGQLPRPGVGPVAKANNVKKSLGATPLRLGLPRQCRRRLNRSGDKGNCEQEEQGDGNYRRMNSWFHINGRLK